MAFSPWTPFTFKPPGTKKQTPAGNAPAPPPTTGGVDYYANVPKEATPFDFSGAVNSNPFLQQIRASSAAGKVTQFSELSELVKRSLINRGLDLDADSMGKALGLNADLMKRFKSIMGDPALRELIRKNTQGGFSLAAQIDKNKERGTMALRQQLAARGGLTSGGLSPGLARVGEQAKMAEHDANQQTLNAILGANTSYNDFLYQQSLQEAQALQEAYAAAQGAAASHYQAEDQRMADARLAAQQAETQARIDANNAAAAASNAPVVRKRIDPSISRQRLGLF